MQGLQSNLCKMDENGKIDLYIQNKIKDVSVDTSDLPPFPFEYATSNTVNTSGVDTATTTAVTTGSDIINSNELLVNVQRKYNNTTGGILEINTGNNSGALFTSSSSQKNPLSTTQQLQYLQPIKSSTRNMLPNLEESKRALNKIKQELLNKKHTRVIVESNET